MANTRFLSKTKRNGITTAGMVVVMLLLLLTIACSSEKKEIVDVAFDPEKTYTMKATEVNSLVSDSGLTRYRLNAKEWLVFDKAKDPYWHFPEGIYVEKFDTLFQAEASIKADTAFYFSKRELWRLVGNVKVESLQGEKFDTSELFWNQKEGKVYSDKYIRIEQEDKIITGVGFESNQEMTQYKIFNSKGTFPVSESKASGNPTGADSLQNVSTIKQ
ncbi:MAG: LPS export ABC transporter periplasmic protein LptC [Parabacteroides sp.]|nr:LPS export ABC transporter periplasmic protein LptC [Parabacteroides sp.]